MVKLNITSQLTATAKSASRYLKRYEPNILMRKLNKENLILALGLFLIAVALYLLWAGASFFIHALASADPKISAAIIAAMTTVFVGLAAVIITQKQTKLREIEEAHRKKKVEIYQKFLTTVISLIAGENEKVTMKAPTEQELIDYLVGFKTDILLWGSPKVIKSQLDFEATSAAGGDVLKAVDKIYQAIREDIGLSNKGLNNFELIKLFLKDLTELDRERASNKSLNLTGAKNAPAS